MIRLQISLYIDDDSAYRSINYFLNKDGVWSQGERKDVGLAEMVHSCQAFKEMGEDAHT